MKKNGRIALKELRWFEYVKRKYVENLVRRANRMKCNTITKEREIKKNYRQNY